MQRTMPHVMRLTLAALVSVWCLPIGAAKDGVFRAGAAVVDVTPQKFPVLVNGGMTSRSLDKVKTPVTARTLVCSDGATSLAIVIVDSCMMSRQFLDDVKALAAARTGIPAGQMLIAATHAHSAPASMGCLGTDADPDYVPFLRERLVESIVAAQAKQEPARIGFARIPAPDYTALRQWIRRPDRVVEDPFGNRTVRANMHAGANLDDVTGEAGPEDPELSLISVQTVGGQPLAVLANFSMHYFGDSDISADYFGLFAGHLERGISPGSGFVAMMSHGCSGDIWRRDYRHPETWNPQLKIEEYAVGLGELALQAFSQVQYRSDVTISMAEERLPMVYRVPNRQLLDWAQRIVEPLSGQQPKDQVQVYAREQLLLHELQRTEVVVQALRIGEIGIATTPNETYAVTGLKIKAASPLTDTMVIELANGGDGYIPPPEQHPLGGYNTWAARSAGLEVTAEPRIAQSAIRLLESVSGQQRRPWRLPEGTAAEQIRTLRPLAWWRLHEFHAPLAADSSGHHRHAQIEPGVTFWLEGPASESFCGIGVSNRCMHFCGGRLAFQAEDLASQYSVSMWFWNGMPATGREVAGWLYSRDHDGGVSRFGEHLGIGGSSASPGKLIFQGSSGEVLAGPTEIPRWTWNHLLFVRDGERFGVYLNGKPEFSGKSAEVTIPQIWLGGRSDNSANWEGRLDEPAIFSRALTADEAARLARISP
ncbi:MAG: LamG domain-containing protein [Planctomycetota bacterium]